MREWSETLACAVKNTADCLKLLEERKSRAGHAATAALAEVLLSEREKTPADLVRPRVIWIDLPSEEKLKTELGEQIRFDVVVASGTVDTTGRFRDAVLLRTSYSKWLDAAILHSLTQALFRPAIVDGEFVEEQAEYVYRLDPR